jgi:hypothetical protein
MTEGQKSETLWILGKDGRTMTCIVVDTPRGKDLRVLLDGEVYLNESHTVRDGAIGRAVTLRHGFEAHGWIPMTE